ncbi:MAG: DUF1415 domain-containing protein [Ferruginibacter sp.]
MNNETIIANTTKWIEDVVIGFNFCPFARKELKRGSIHYEVLNKATNKSALEALSVIFIAMDDDAFIETSLLIMPLAFEKFQTYLDLLQLAESLLFKENYDGVYQLASFHPKYLFAGSTEKDTSNYTNRSPYPMLHVLREESLSLAIDNYPDTNKIPANNIIVANKIGLANMIRLRDACL